MLCQDCGRAAAADAAFCAGCGSRLAQSCEGCGREIEADARFCSGCGRPVADATSADAAGEAPTSRPAPLSSEVSETRTLLAPSGSSSPGAQLIGAGRYSIVRRLGEGANKRVYLARDTRLDRDVALAEIKAEALGEDGRARLQRETQAMGQLGDHEGIVTVHDVLEEADRVYIVSQYMGGGDLARHLESREEARLPPAEAMSMALEVARALEHAHESGVVHRDIKPSNIWLTADGSAKLGDFGLAFALDRTRLTQEGMMVGTAAYMPPEQALGKLPDIRSDLYALGATRATSASVRPRSSTRSPSPSRVSSARVSASGCWRRSSTSR